jgi:type VI secretion system protein VasG
MAATDAMQEPGSEVTSTALMEVVRPQLLEHFQPALLARFQTIVYRPLTAYALAEIVRMKLDKVVQRVAQRFNVSLICDDTLLAELVRACRLPDSGARNIDSLLDQQILPVLSRELLLRSARRQLPSSIQVSYADDQGVTLEFETAVELVE